MENSEEFCPENYSQPCEEHYRPPKKNQKYVSGSNNGIWSDLQHTKYIVFMENSKEKMRSKQKRRTNKLYKAMANYIGTRNALQCRSHHQKLQEKYVYPNKIIAHFKTHNELTLYHQLKQELEGDNRISNSLTIPDLKLQESASHPIQVIDPSVRSQTDQSVTPTSPSLSGHLMAVPLPGEVQQYAYPCWPPVQEVGWSPCWFYSFMPTYSVSLKSNQ